VEKTIIFQYLWIHYIDIIRGNLGTEYEASERLSLYELAKRLDRMPEAAKRAIRQVSPLQGIGYLQPVERTQSMAAAGATLAGTGRIFCAFNQALRTRPASSPSLIACKASSTLCPGLLDTVLCQRGKIDASFLRRPLASLAGAHG